MATVGDIEKAGGKITLDGKLNSNGNMVMNHATVDGLTAEQSEKLIMRHYKQVQVVLILHHLSNSFYR